MTDINHSCFPNSCRDENIWRALIVKARLEEAQWWNNFIGAAPVHHPTAIERLRILHAAAEKEEAI